jgi:hypothetical protein
MDKAGGIGAAMHDGTLLKGTEDKERQDQLQTLEERRALAKLNQRALDFLAEKTPEAKSWLAGDPKGYILSHDHDQSVALVKEAYELGMTDIHTIGQPIDFRGNNLVGGLVGTLPADKDKRKKVFAWYEQIPKTAHHPDFAFQQELGQTHLTIEFLPD